MALHEAAMVRQALALAAGAHTTVMLTAFAGSGAPKWTSWRPITGYSPPHRINVITQRLQGITGAVTGLDAAATPWMREHLHMALDSVSRSTRCCRLRCSRLS